MGGTGGTQQVHTRGHGGHWGDTAGTHWGTWRTGRGHGEHMGSWQGHKENVNEHRGGQGEAGGPERGHSASAAHTEVSTDTTPQTWGQSFLEFFSPGK